MKRHEHSLAPEDIIRTKVKAELRKRLRGVRKTAPLEACQARSALIVGRLSELDVVRTALSAAFFWPIEARHEVDLRALDASMRTRGVRIAYPAIDPNTGEMQFRFVVDPASMEEHGYGFQEPSAECEIATALDVIFVPAVAVDSTGHRIGYGAGYYDRALPRFASAASIAVAYDYQLIVEVPATEGDVRVGWIVTDARTLRAEV